METALKAGACDYVMTDLSMAILLSLLIRREACAEGLGVGIRSVLGPMDISIEPGRLLREQHEPVCVPRT
jgi:hypothetical protein